MRNALPRGFERTASRYSTTSCSNQLLVSFGAPEVTRAVIDGLQAGGVCWCGGTVWQGRTATRISVSGWATTEADVDASIAAIADGAAGAGAATDDRSAELARNASLLYAAR